MNENMFGWEVEHLLAQLAMESQFPGVVFRAPRHLINIWGKPSIGAGTELAAFVEIGDGVTIGERCKIAAFVFLPPGVTIGNDVFVGPRATFTNDPHPPSPREAWLPTVVEDNASIGAGAVILPGIRIGKGATVGAGAVVTHDVPHGATVAGNPARVMGTRPQGLNAAKE